MKKYFYFLAIAVLFAACQNKQNEELGAPFQKGQKVTLSATIANPDGGAKQIPGKQRVSGIDDTPSDPINGAIKLTWNEGYQIKVTVNGVSETFILKSGAGTAEGEFEGFMPAEGTTYAVDYPVTAPNLANQKNAMEGMGSMGAIMSFGDEKARIIDHLYVNNTTYGLNTYLYGEGNYCPAPQNGEKVKIIATPTDEYGEGISGAETSEFYLCDGPNNVVQYWTKWDLSKLGKVYGLAFSIEGYSNAVPYAFAIDDIVVRFPKE